ncbi:hypothetical protein C8R46DRAFT_1219576 [Mycena filopes]|nr:hypothetical protein C8R46DRAFT_1219576 [Mycena filopes]
MSDAKADFLADVQACCERRQANPRKRQQAESSPSAMPLVSRNVATNIQNHAKKQRLCGDQLNLVDTFLTDSQTVRDAKLYIGVLALQNDLQKIIATKPAYNVSAELKANIQAYVAPVLLSPKLEAYKGTEPVQIIFIYAEAAKITTVIEEAFTQGRSQLKKLILASVKITRDKVNIDLPVDKHLSLFALAQIFVKGTKCRITPGLCGRVALMRKIYLKHPGNNFWDKLDEHLAMIMSRVGGQPMPLVGVSCLYY